MSNTILKVHNLQVNIGEKSILKRVDIQIHKGEVHVIMGPNGSGKSTFANVLMGHPKFHVVGGSIEFFGKDISGLEPEERAGLGMFMAFQYPKEIAGVQMDRFLFTAYNNLLKARGEGKKSLSVFDFNKKLLEETEKLKMKPEFISRSINEGFSGGEKKKAEMLQLGVLDPKFAILDETDSGLDVDALKIVGEAINRFKNGERSVLIVTHYQRLLQYLKPDHIHIMVNGVIVQSGGLQLAQDLEKEGYAKFLNSNS